MSTKNKRVKPKPKPKKVNLLELSNSKKTRLLKKAKYNLRQKLAEARFCQSFAEAERITINGQTINF